MPNSPHTFDTMRLEQKSTVAVVTLARPDAMNAMNQQFFTDFQSIIQILSDDNNTARALLIMAEGKGFCTGADLKDQAGEMPPNLGKTLRDNYNPLIIGLKKLPMPTIVAVDGAVAGAGFSLVCACDLAIASPKAYFLQAFINIALIPDAGSTYFLPRLVGRARAASLMMLGERLLAEQALEYGVISHIIPQDTLKDEAISLATKLASMPTKSLITIRNLLDQSEVNSLEEQLEVEAKAQQIAGHSADFIEGVTAFMRKRPPIFQGK